MSDQTLNPNPNPSRSVCANAAGDRRTPAGEPHCGHKLIGTHHSTYLYGFLKRKKCNKFKLAHFIKKPLRTLWISQNTLIWLNEVPSYNSWDFTPIILISASNQGVFVNKTEYSEFKWDYIPGSGDDEESWAKGHNP